MKISIKFLRKVQRGHVYLRRTYSPTRGGGFKFIGGEATAQFHAGAGLIHMPYAPAASLGQPALAKLTEQGEALLKGPGA